MNQEQVNGDWDTIKGKAKRIWGELTDDDFTKAQGSFDKLCGTIERKFGDTKAQIKQKLESFRDKLDAKVDSLRSKAGSQRPEPDLDRMNTDSDLEAAQTPRPSRPQSNPDLEPPERRR
jgi:uncharacterized protein YjbJ (UPF0337 family)